MTACFSPPPGAPQPALRPAAPHRQVALQPGLAMQLALKTNVLTWIFRQKNFPESEIWGSGTGTPSKEPALRGACSSAKGHGAHLGRGTPGRSPCLAPPFSCQKRKARLRSRSRVRCFFIPPPKEARMGPSLQLMPGRPGDHVGPCSRSYSRAESL